MSVIQVQKVEALLRDKRVEEAQRLCVRLAQRHSNDTALLISLARVTYAGAAYEAASSLCNRILLKQPRLAPALLFRGLALMALGKVPSALQDFEQGLSWHPDAWEFHVNKAMALERLEQMSDAIASYERAIKLNPRCLEACNNLGNVLQRLDRNDEAVERYTQALALSPGYVTALYNRGTVLNKLGRFRLALTDFDLALALQPDFAPALSDRSIALTFLGRIEDALDSCDEALRLLPDLGLALANRGVVLNHLGCYEQALVDFDRAQALLGETAEILNGRALALRFSGQLSSALDCHNRAIALFPKSVQSHIDRGVTLLELGEIQMARDSYDAALTIDPGSADAHLNKGLLELGQGNFASGWQGYEYRFTRRGAEPRVFESIPAWNGETIGSAQRLLVWSEQGVGDEVLFASIYPELRHLGKRCIIECRPKLVDLFRRSFPWASFIVRDEALSAELRSSIAYQVPAASLGKFLRRSLDEFPKRDGYLTADPDRLTSWRTRLTALGPGLKVGFSWRSSNLMADRALTCTTLDEWAPLFAVAGVHWVSLQYDDCTAELESARSRFGMPLHRFAEVDYYDGLDNVAALMKALDLVITAPTSVSMQAAALGVKTWQMSYGPEWQTHGTPGFPWLPTLMRFNRQRNESWQDLLGKVAQLLRDPLRTRNLEHQHLRNSCEP